MYENIVALEIDLVLQLYVSSHKFLKSVSCSQYKIPSAEKCGKILRSREQIENYDGTVYCLVAVCTSPKEEFHSGGRCRIVPTMVIISK